jgi:hypothetical protein
VFKRLLIVVVGVLLIGWTLTPPKIPQKIQVLPLNVEQFSIPKSPPQTYKDRIILPNNMLCPEWAQLAVNVGWEEQDLAKLDSVIHRESRCFTWVHYGKDPTGGSFGLTQINAYWCKPSKWYPNGYLQTFGVLNSCEELYLPRVNLLAARLIWLYSHKEYGNGWLPWRA